MAAHANVANVLNHLVATSITVDGDTATGLTVETDLTGNVFDIESSTLVTPAGSWSGFKMSSHRSPSPSRKSTHTA